MLKTEVSAPAFALYENGSKVTDKALLSSLLRIIIDERVDQATICALELSDRGLARSGGKNLVEGASLKVELGYTGATDVLFDGEVTSWRESFPRRGPAVLTVIALDRMHRMKRERKNKTYCSMKDSDIIKQVLQAQGLQVKADATDVTHPYVLQANQSDADFVLARAAVNGYELLIDGKQAQFRKPKLDDQAAVTLKWKEDLTSFTAYLSLAKAHSSVTTTGFDVMQKQQLTSSVAAGKESSSMGGAKTGNQVFQESLQASEPTADPFRPPLSQDEAQLLAQAALDKDSRQFLTGEGRVPGNTKVRRGSVVEIDGIGDYLSGNYYVTTAIHTLTPWLGYATTFRVQRPSIQKKAPPPQAQGEKGKQGPGPAQPTGPVEFMVQNQFGEPVEGLEYVLTAPDGTKKTGTVPANGIVREENAKPGIYKLALKGVDPPQIDFEKPDEPEAPGSSAGGGGDSPAPVNAGDIAVAVVDQSGLPASGIDWKLDLPDGTSKTGKTDAQGKINLETKLTGNATLSFPSLAGGDSSASGSSGAGDSSGASPGAGSSAAPGGS